MPTKLVRAGGAVHEGDAVEQEGGGERAQHEVLEAGLLRLHPAQVHGRQHVHRDREGLEAEEQHDEVVGHGHDDAAGAGDAATGRRTPRRRGPHVAANRRPAAPRARSRRRSRPPRTARIRPPRWRRPRWRTAPAARRAGPTRAACPTPGRGPTAARRRVPRPGPPPRCTGRTTSPWAACAPARRWSSITIPPASRITMGSSARHATSGVAMRAAESAASNDETSPVNGRPLVPGPRCRVWSGPHRSPQGPRCSGAAASRRPGCWPRGTRG